MRSNHSDGVLNDLNPSLAEPFLILRIIKRNYFVLEQSVNSSCIKTVLILLILVGALLGECPSGSLTIALQPPAILHTEVDDTIHFGLLTAGA